jgi:hypothetical protein
MIVDYDDKGKPQVKPIEALIHTVKGDLWLNTESYSDIIERTDQEVLKVDDLITKNALNKCHGDWYEWLIAITAWNYRLKEGDGFLLLNLPNVSSFDVSSLYENNLFDHINDFKKKVLDSTGASLITSNPDFVIIDATNITLPSVFNTPITNIDEKTIKMIGSACKELIGKCRFSDIKGYLSVKTSLRPDRRLQLAHEGSLMKALYAHLQTREWIINPDGIMYYAATIEAAPADHNALSTIATHTIANVQSKPEAAVDQLFEIDSNITAHKVFERILF